MHLLTGLKFFVHYIMCLDISSGAGFLLGMFFAPQVIPILFLIKVLRKLRGHGNEIQTLVWSPPGHKHTFSCAERNGTSSHQSVGQGSASYAQ